MKKTKLLQKLAIETKPISKKVKAKLDKQRKQIKALRDLLRKQKAKN